MADKSQAGNAIMQSSRLLELSPELLDMILIECYKEILLLGTTLSGLRDTYQSIIHLRAPVRGWLCLDFEKTCRTIRNRALAVRALALERTVIVKKYWAFDSFIYGLSSSGGFAWLARSLTSIKIDDPFQPFVMDSDWKKLLRDCPRLREVHFTLAIHRRLWQRHIQSYQPLDREDSKRALARAIVRGDLPMETLRDEVFEVLSELELYNTLSTQKRDIKSQAITRITFVSDCGRTEAVEVTAAYKLRRDFNALDLGSSAVKDMFMMSRRCVIGRVEEIVKFSEADTTE